MSELKPCPFCGGKVKVLHDPDGTPSGVHCRCGALTRFLFMPKVIGETFGEVQDRIANRWNSRAEQPTIEARKKGKWIPVTRIEEWHEEEGLVGFPPEVKEFPQCTIKWVDATEPDEVDGLRCSECDTVYDFTEARNWCSECGADMREPEDIPMEYFESGGR